MKQIITLLFSTALFISGLGACAYEQYDFNAIKDNQQVTYSPELKTWNTGAMAEDRIVLTKKMSIGSGGFSEYYYSDGTLASQIGSNFEFITLDGRLIACHNADLKIFEMTMENGKLIEKELSEKEIQEIFPDVEIIKISQFKNNQISVCKKPFKNKEILLLNDTDESFYKYSFKPRSVKKTWVAGLINIERYEQIKFSHFNDDNENFPALTINTRFCLR